jgi:hypothetical protein
MMTILAILPILPPPGKTPLTWSKMVAQNTLEIIRDAEVMVAVKTQMMSTEENEKKKRGRTAMQVEATIAKVTNQMTYATTH